MSARRGFLLLGTLKHLQRNPSVNRGLICSNVNQQLRKGGNSSFAYRKVIEDPEKKKTEILMGAFWWWILWHLFTEYEEFYKPVFPEPSEWTDEELGIPPI